MVVGGSEWCRCVHGRVVGDEAVLCPDCSGGYMNLRV